MKTHSIYKIQKLQTALDERMSSLKKAMEGYEPHPHLVSGHSNPESLRQVNESEIRIAADDFNTILKEIKSVLK